MKRPLNDYWLEIEREYRTAGMPDNAINDLYFSYMLGARMCLLHFIEEGNPFDFKKLQALRQELIEFERERVVAIDDAEGSRDG